MQDPESCQIPRELALPRAAVNPRDKQVAIILDLKNVMSLTRGAFFGYETDHLSSRVVTVDIGLNFQNSWLAKYELKTRRHGYMLKSKLILMVMLTKHDVCQDRKASLEKVSCIAPLRITPGSTTLLR